jgi:NhaP-type Na+/H+ and K+/H+ antiporter
MLFAVMVASSGVDNGGVIRIVLFVMVLVAVALLLAGCTIALMTFYKQFKAPDRM